MSKVAKIAAVVVGVVAIVATGGLGAPLAGAVTGFLGVGAGTLTAIATGLSIAGAVLAKPPSIPSSQGERLNLSIDPQTPRKSVVGNTALPADVRYQEWFGTNQERCGLIVGHAAHRIQSVDAIWLNDELAWTSAGGVQGRYVNYFWVRRVVTEGSPSIIASVSSSGRWNASCRLTGCAYSHLEFKVTGNSSKVDSPFSSGIPQRITFVGKGSPVYDPRRDSTVAGGSGPMRADDQSTWRYVADDGVTIGENVALQILREKLGWRITNPQTGAKKISVGLGLPVKRIDLPSYIVAANLCDEVVTLAAGGTERRYVGAAVLSEGDDPTTRLNMLCAACCGRITETAGKLGLAIAHNDLASIAADDGLNDDDLVGPFVWQADPAITDTPNVVRGRYTDPSPNSLYQALPYPDQGFASPDGIDRTLALDLAAVQSPAQAQRVAAQSLVRKQYDRTLQATFDIRAWKYRIGDPLPLTLAALGFNRKPFRVVDQQYTAGGKCAMTLRVEDPAIYPVGGADRPVVQAAAPNVYDTSNNPIIQGVRDAQSSATSALGIATAAAAGIAALGDDGVLTVNEKITKLVPLEAELANAFSILDAQAAAMASIPIIADARQQADASYAAWTSYLATLSPAWNNITIDTFVDRNAFNGKINDLRYALGLLEQALRTVASISGYLTNQAVSVAADSAGTVASFEEAGGTFRVLAGSRDVTTGEGTTYSVQAANGVSISIDATTGIYTVTAMSADTGSAKLRAIYGGVIIDRVYSIAKAKAGADGSGTAALSLQLTKRSMQLQAYADGAVRGYGSANGQLTLRSGTTDVTSGAILSLSAVGCFATINTGFGVPVAGKPKGYYQVTDMGADDATLTISATLSGQTLTDVVSIAKIRGGYEILDTVPTAGDPDNFEGRLILSRADGKLWRFHGGAWTSAVPAADLIGTLASSQLGIGVGGNQLVGAVPGSNPRNYMRFAYNPDNIVYADVTTGGGATSGQGVIESPNFGNWIAGSPWTLSDGSSFGLFQPNADQGGAGFSDLRMARLIDKNGTLDEYWPVEGGKSYEFSFWAGSHSCQIEALIVWCDGDRVPLAESDHDYLLVDECQGGTTLDSYKRLVVRDEAPANARLAMLILRKCHTTTVPAGRSTSWLFGTRPMFGETTPNATEALPYSPPAVGWLMAENVVARSITGQEVAFDTLTGNHMKIGSVDAARLNVTELSAITAKIGFLTSRPNGQGAGFEQDNNGYRLFASNNVLAIEITV